MGSGDSGHPLIPMNSALVRYSLSKTAVNAELDKHRKTREHRAMDATISTVFLTICGATLGVLSPEASEMTLLLAVPLMGAALVTGGVLIMNPQLETKNITIGRAIFGLVIGVPGPWALTALIQYWNMPALATFLKLPPLLFLAGLAMSYLAVIISWPFTRKMYERSDGIAGYGVKRLEKAAGMPEKRDDEK